MVKINWTEQAIGDLENIGEFIAKDSPGYAAIQLKRIRNRVRVLKNYPFLGRIVPEFQNEIIRELIIGSYRIIIET